MAPENASLPKRKPKENRFLFDLGVKGRKTGITLPDTGIRDEHGMEPMDHLFSSPEKPEKMPLKHKNMNGTIPEPTEVIAERKRVGNMRIPPPRSKSPIKTYLKSPARRNPSMGPGSSPTRDPKAPARAASISAPVRRRLDFSNASFDDSENHSETQISSQKRGGSAMPSISTTKLMNGQRLQPGFSDFDNNLDESMQDDTAIVGEEDSFQMIDAGGDDNIPDPEQEPQEVTEENPVVPEPAEEPVRTKKGKGKPKAIEVAQPTGKRGRPKKQSLPIVQEQLEEKQSSPTAEVVEPLKKKGRPRKLVEPTIVEEKKQPSPAPSPEIEKSTKKGGKIKRPAGVEEPEEDPRPAKRSRRSLNKLEATESKKTSKNAAATASTTTAKGPKTKGRKPKLEMIAESDSPIVQRGPPIPRANLGLFIVRRETPIDGGGFKQTRSGRNSIKPVNYWKGEKIEYNTDMTEDRFGGKRNFLMPTIKVVVRTEETEQPKRIRAKSRAPKSKKRAESETEDDDLEPWELEPGLISGDIRVWDPVDQLGSSSEEVEADIAFSSAAIVTTEIPGASFRFAKTLTLPFFGSGMVDLPPGGVKKQKNSRKMQMVFFVHRGRVQVTVNDTAFRIGQGGMWQVPRGNFYSIENDYDKEARIFFSQGCEIADEAISESQ